MPILAKGPTNISCFGHIVVNLQMIRRGHQKAASFVVDIISVEGADQGCSVLSEAFKHVKQVRLLPDEPR